MSLKTAITATTTNATTLTSGSNGRIIVNTPLSILGNIHGSGDLVTPAITFDSGRMALPKIYHIMGSPVNSAGSGTANSFAVWSGQSRGLSFTTSPSPGVVVPVSGLYLVTYNTVCEDQGVTRRDANIEFSNGITVNTLSETNLTGRHGRSASITIWLNAGTRVSWSNTNWYQPLNAGVTPWRTASVTYLG